MTNAEQCAFANPGSDQGPGSSGLTKREYFAAMAMQGLAKHWFEIHDSENNAVGINATVNLAVLMADELLKQLES